MSPIEEKFYTNLNEVGVEFLIRESFLGYKYRKQNGKLYAADSEVPTKLIAAYYGLNFDEKKFDSMKKAFISKYIRNESKLEGLDVNNAHDKTEVEGLALMYEYIHSPEIDENFSVYTLLNLHIKLFSLTPDPGCGGTTRTSPAYLPGTSADLCPWEFIFSELNKLDSEVKNLVEIAKHLKGANDINQLFKYIDRCIELKCKLIKIHPFYDGNGRSVRCFINKLFENAGLPPVYIKPSEREEYLKAMDMMSHDGDYSYIKNFYRYKICDSIIELDINNKIKDSNNIIDVSSKKKIMVKKKEQQ